MSIPVFKPFFDQNEIQASVESLELGWLGPGSYVRDFEHRIANLLMIDPAHVVAVNTGTSAVHLGLISCGVGLDDEVITPSFNNIADFQSIIALGAKPVFCDVNEDDLTIDIGKVESLITDKTKAIICIDYGSALCDYFGLKRIADKYGIKVLYDAAHSFGSQRDDSTMVGSEADITCFSFDPAKNISCIDGGAIIYKSLESAEKARYMRLLGQMQNQTTLYSNTRSWTYDVQDIGFRYHLANLHGAIGIKQLEKIETIKIRRQQIFRTYIDKLSDISDMVLPPNVGDGILPFIFVVRILSGRRDDFRDYMKSQGIDIGVHWRPGHQFSLFENCHKGDLSVTETIGNQIATIPMYPDLTVDQQTKIISAIKSFFS